MDAHGRVQGRDKVMLHHIVFAKVGVPDYTCGGSAERFFAEGEERLALSLPRGYGYANKATDRWGLLYMLMNHKPQRLNGFIRYTVRYVTGEALTPVKPIWLDVRNCTRPRSRLRRPRRRQALLDLHEDGRLHDAGERPARLRRRPPPRRRHPARAAQRDLRDDAVRVAPDLGRPEAEAAAARARADEDVLVPLDRRGSRSRGADAPARRGLRQRGAAHAGDGDHAPLPRAGSRRGLRRDAGARHRPRPARPRRRRSRCRCRARRRARSRRRRPPSSATSSTAPSASCSSAARRSPGASWAPFQHDVTVVGGPEGFSAPVDADRRLHAPLHQGGTYRLFCSLHPAKMVQQITV